MSALPKVGAHAGWYLDFFPTASRASDRVVGIGSSDYHGSIEATLPSGLDPGSYTFIVEGVTSEDYQKLYQKRDTLYVELYAYWRDVNVVSYLVDLGGLSDSVQGDRPPKGSLVAVLRVTALERRAGTRRYELVVKARELVFDQLTRPLPKAGSVSEKSASAAVAELLSAFGDVSSESCGSEDEPKTDWSWAQGEVAAQRLNELGEAMQNASRRFGLGMYLLREGKLIYGPDRFAKTKGNAARSLDYTNGLLQIASRGQEETGSARDARRDLFELTLRGRPDIKPGHLVDFRRPPEERDGAPADLPFDVESATDREADTTAYVRTVQHVMSRTIGFTTTLQVVTVKDELKPWYEHDAPKRPSQAHAEAAKAHDDGQEGFVTALLRRLLAQPAGIEVAQVRKTNGKESIAQTERLWVGSAPDQGTRYGAVRLALPDQGAAKFEAAPVATAFAWGKFGQIVPRYPGMRVLLAYRQGSERDPVDVGALYGHGSARASEPGDWWLSLPARLEADRRESVADDRVPAEPEGKATNDLIDADGNRVIEVGKLVVRVSHDKDRLPDGGTRPALDGAAVLIEHQSGARIRIDQDGNVSIEAKKALTLAGESITIDSQNDVIVKVGGVMDVKGRS